ncbi:MAG: hypothetical protein OK449_03880 [Thaumarchaeota archaeon]|nr:hypothetical protein [Nitrososphaerota archaeon]
MFDLKNVHSISLARRSDLANDTLAGDEIAELFERLPLFLGYIDYTFEPTMVAVNRRCPLCV